MYRRTMVGSRWASFWSGMRGDRMTAPSRHSLPTGHALFARYAFPPTSSATAGPPTPTCYCAATMPGEVASHAKEFDGAWPYLRAIAEAAGIDDALDADVVASYWVGGPLLDRVEAGPLLGQLRSAFTGQVTGLLADLDHPTGVLAHHSFHVFVVYPWVRFLDRDRDNSLAGTAGLPDPLGHSRLRRGRTRGDAVAAADIPGRVARPWRTDGRAGAVEQGRRVADRRACTRRHGVRPLGLGLLAPSPKPRPTHWPMRRTPPWTL